MPDRSFKVTKFWIPAISGVALELKSGVPTYQVEDEEGRIHVLLQLPIDEENQNRWCFWRPIRQALILVSGPITNIAFVPPLPDQLAVFEGASDARTEELMNSYGLDLLGPPLS